MSGARPGDDRKTRNIMGKILNDPDDNFIEIAVDPSGAVYTSPLSAGEKPSVHADPESGSVTTSSKELVPANSDRRDLMFRNTATIPANPNTGPIIWISWGKPAVAGKGFPIYPGEGWTVNDDNPTHEALFGITSAGVATFSYQEGV